MDYNTSNRDEWSGHLRDIRVSNGLEPISAAVEESATNPSVSLGGFEIREEAVGIGSPRQPFRTPISTLFGACF